MCMSMCMYDVIGLAARDELAQHVQHPARSGQGHVGGREEGPGGVGCGMKGGRRSAAQYAEGAGVIARARTYRLFGLSTVTARSSQLPRFDRLWGLNSAVRQSTVDSAESRHVTPEGEREVPTGSVTFFG